MCFVTREGVQCCGVDAVEDGPFDVGIVPLQTAQQRFDLLTFCAASAVVADGTISRKAAGALDELQLVVLTPGDDILFVDTIHRANELHALEVGAVEHGQHGLQLRAV